MRVVMVGYGRVGPRHAEALAAHGVEVVAVCCRSEPARERARAEGRIPRAYAAPLEMIERERPDGVVCCPSFDQNFAVAAELIPTGIPLLLEKPPGRNLVELDALRALQRRHGTAVQVGLNRRCFSVLQRALADAGGPAAITSVAVEWSEDPRLHLERGMAAADVANLSVLNSLHGLDLLLYLAGPLADPAIARVDLGPPFRRLMAVQGVSARGVLAGFRSTWDAPASWRMTMTAAGRVYGFAPLERGAVQDCGGGPERVIEADEVDRRFKPGFWEQARRFVELMRPGAAASTCSLDDAAPAMALADRLTAVFEQP